MSKEKVEINEIWKKEIRKRTPIYLIGVIFHTITIIINLTIPVIIGHILDMLLEGNFSKEQILNEAIKLIILIIVHIIPRFIYRRCYYTNARYSDTQLRKKVAMHLQKVNPEYFEKEEKGTYLAYLSQELMLAHKSFGNIYADITCVIGGTIISTIYSFNTFHPIIGGVILPIFIITILYIVKQYKSLENSLEESRQEFVELSKNIQRNTDGFTLIKMYNEQNDEKTKFEDINNKTYNANIKIGVVKNKISNGMNIAYAASYILTFGIGLFLVKNNMMTLGILTGAIGSIEFALSDIMNSTVPLLNAMGLYKQTRRRYNYFYNLEEYKKDGKSLEQIDKIEIRNLTYSFGENNVLENINMTIKRGEKVGIIGQVASGKTTLMNIISGFYKVPQNTVFINDIDINEYNRDDIFKNINYAMQKNVLRTASIKENVKMNCNQAEEDIWNSLELAQLKDEVENMEEKLDTKVGQTATRLSGGQKQRVSIARNLNFKRDVSIYDDTLSALDQETEEKVLDNIIKQERDNILIVISNKISHMQKMDKVYLLVDGKIQDEGSHIELLQRNDLYKELQAYEKVGDVI